MASKKKGVAAVSNRAKRDQTEEEKKAAGKAGTTGSSSSGKKTPGGKSAGGNSAGSKTTSSKPTSSGNFGGADLKRQAQGSTTTTPSKPGTSFKDTTHRENVERINEITRDPGLLVSKLWDFMSGKKPTLPNNVAIPDRPALTTVMDTDSTPAHNAARTALNNTRNNVYQAQSPARTGAVFGDDIDTGNVKQMNPALMKYNLSQIIDGDEIDTSDIQRGANVLARYYRNAEPPERDDWNYTKDPDYAGSIRESSDKLAGLYTAREQHQASMALKNHKSEFLTDEERQAAIANLDPSLPGYEDAISRLQSDEPIRRVEMYSEDTPLFDDTLTDPWLASNYHEIQRTERELKRRQNEQQEERWFAREGRRWNEVQAEVAASGFQYKEPSRLMTDEEVINSVVNRDNNYPKLFGNGGFKKVKDAITGDDLMQYWTYDERNTYEYLLANGRVEEAEEYKDYLAYDASARRADDYVQTVNNVFGGMNASDGILDDAPAIAASTFTYIYTAPIKAIGQADLYIQEWWNNSSLNRRGYRPVRARVGVAGTAALNENRAINAQYFTEMGTVNDVVRGITGNPDITLPAIIGDRNLGDVYNTWVDRGVASMNAYMFGQGKGSLAGMSLESGYDTFNENVANGVSRSRSLEASTPIGGMEALGEQVGFDLLTNALNSTGTKPWWKSVLGFTLAWAGDAAGEMTTEAGQQMFEIAILGDQSSWSQAYNGYLAELDSIGVRGEEAEIFAQALVDEDRSNAVMLAGVLSLLGSGTMTVAAPAASVVNRYRRDTDIGQRIIQLGNDGTLAEWASDMKGEDVSAPKTAHGVGRMYSNFAKNASKYAERAAQREDVDASVAYYNEMRNAGQGEGTTAAPASDAQMKAVREALERTVRGKKLTGDQQKTVQGDKNLADTIAAYNDGDKIIPDRTTSERIKRRGEIAGRLTQVSFNKKGKNATTQTGTTDGVRRQAEGVAAKLKRSDAEGTTVNGETIKEVNGIKQVANGDQDAVVTVTMADGSARDVKLNEITWGANASTTAYEYAAIMKTPELANEFRYASRSENVGLDQLANGMNTAYDMGLAGFNNIATVKASSLTKGLSADIVTRAYNMGVEARSRSLEGKLEKAARQFAKADGRQWRPGSVRLDASVDLDAMEPGQRKIVEQNIQAATVIGTLMGMNVEIFESSANALGQYEHAQGMYIPSTHTIRLDVNAGRNETGDSFTQTAMLRTMSHELTHAMQATMPEKYEQLRNAVQDILRQDKGYNIEREVTKRLAQAEDIARQYNVEAPIKDRDEAIDEIVADACEMMLRDSDALQRLQEAHPEVAKTFIERVGELFDRIIKAIREIFGSEATAESKAVGKTLEEEITKLRDQWSNMLVEMSALQMRKIEISPEVQQRINNEQAISGIDEIKNSIRFDEKYMAAAIRYNDKHGNVDPTVLEQAEIARATVRDFFRDPNNTELLKLPADVTGNTFYSNSSYGGSMENTTVCIRSLAAQQLMDAVARDLGRPLTVQDTLVINQEVASLTDKPECFYCYVATDRRAYREYLGNYLQQRDEVIEKYRKGADRESLYTEYLNKREDTTNMRERFDMWLKAADSGAELISGKDLASLEEVFAELGKHKPKRVKENGKSVAKLTTSRLDQIWDATSYAQSASWAKAMTGYAAYNNRILRFSPKLVDFLNKGYGLRMYSFSDYSPAFVLENMQMITDASVRGLNVLAYTKELDFAEIFAPTGANINVSVFASEVNGEIVSDAMQGADWAAAQDLRSRYDNVGTVMVATSDKIMNWALQQDWIDVVIPYHLVRTGKKVASYFGYKDYTAVSSDKKTLKYKPGNPASVSPVEHHNDIVAYVDKLEEYGLSPRFAEQMQGYYQYLVGDITPEQFREMNPYYMKLVNETRRSYADTKPVQPIFNTEAAMASIDTMIKQGGYYQPIGGSIENQNDVAQEIADKIKASGAKQEAAKYSVRETTDGRKAVVIEKDILEGIYSGGKWTKDQKKSAKAAAKRALANAETTIMNGIPVYISAETRKEFPSSKYVYNTLGNKTELLADRYRAAAGGLELVEAAINWNSDTNYKIRNNNIKRIVSARVLMQIGTRGYDAKVDVGITKTGKYVLYDLVDLIPATFEIKKDISPTADVNETKAMHLEVSYGKIIPQSVTDVNTDIRLSSRVTETDVNNMTPQQADSTYFDALESGDRETVRTVIRALAKKHGYDSPAIYHGTWTFGWTQYNFMKSRKTTERAIFLSTDPDIAGGFGDTSRIRDIDSRVSYTLQDIKGATVERVAEMANEQFGNHTEKADRQIRQEELDAGLDYMNQFADAVLARLDKIDDADAKKAAEYIRRVQGLALDMNGFEVVDILNEAETALKNVWSRDLINIHAAPKLLEFFKSDSQLLVDVITDRLLYDPNENRTYPVSQVKDLLGNYTQRGIYEMYGRTEGLLTIDAKGARWNDLDGAIIGKPGTKITSEAVVQYAQQQKYPGVRILNEIDAASGYGQNVSDIYIYFDNNAIKSADEVVYDDDHNVIPPSERFNVAEADIRYSYRVTDAEADSMTPDQIDSDYMKAVDIVADEKLLMPYVRSIAQRNGYDPLLIYHGTKKFGHTKFDLGKSEYGISIFATNEWQMAQGYTGGRSVVRKAGSVNRVDDAWLATATAADMANELKQLGYKDAKANTDERAATAIAKGAKSLARNIAQLTEALDDAADTAPAVINPQQVEEARRMLDSLGAADYNNPDSNSINRNLKTLTAAVKGIVKDLRSNKATRSIAEDIRDAYDDATFDVEELLSTQGADRITLTRDGEQKTLRMADAARIIKGEGIGGVYQLFGKTGGMLVIDGAGAQWNEIDGALIGMHGKKLKTDDIAAYAKEHKFNGVRIKNIYDYDTITENTPTGDIYIFFNPSDIKSADPITYDADNKIIPPSKRFDDSNTDIRYSTRAPGQMTAREIMAEIVNQYNEELASDGGDQKRMLDLAVDRGKIAAYKAEMQKYAAEQKNLEEPRRVLNELHAKAQYLRNEALIRYSVDSVFNNIDGTDLMRITAAENKIRTLEALPALNEYQRTELQKAVDAIEAIREKTGATEEEFAEWRALKYNSEMDDEKILNPDDRKKLKRARNEIKAISKRLAEQDKILMGMEAAAPMRNLVERERERLQKEADKRVERTQQAYANKAVRDRLRRKMSRLDDMLRHPKDGDYIPDGLRVATLDFLQMMYDKTGRAAMNWRDEKEINKRKQQEKENSRRIERLLVEYQAIAAENERLGGEMDEGIVMDLTELRKNVGTKDFGHFTARELQLVKNVVEHLSWLINKDMEAFVEGRSQRVEMLANEITEWSTGRDARKKNQNGIAALARQYITDEMSPIVFLRNIGGPLQRLGQDLLNAESDYGIAAEEMRRKVEALQKKHNRDKWDMNEHLELVLENGGTLQLNYEEALMLYATHRRQEENIRQEARHLNEGGVVEQHSDKRLAKLADGDSGGKKVTDNDIARIREWVGEDKIAYADDMVALMSGSLANMLNEASIKLSGYSKFGENYYFPYKVSGDHIARNQGDAQKTLLKNWGSAKRTTANASKAIVLSEFTATVSEHIENALKYAIIAVPQDNIHRVLNYQYDSSNSVKTQLKNAYGKHVPKYLESWIDDIYGNKAPEGGSLVGLSSKLFSGMKRNAVVWSASVWTQQYSAIYRAWAEVAPIHFYGKVHNPAKSWEEAKQYAGTAVIKEIGRFDTGVGKNVADWIGGAKPDTWQDKIFDKTAFMPEIMDKLGWVRIWEAVKREQAKDTGLSIDSEELLNIAGKRFDEVVRLTQVYDSVFANNAYLRDKNPWAKMLTSFGGEPARCVNMWIDAVNSKSPRKILRTAGAMFMSSLAKSMLLSFVRAYRDDDEEKTYWEKYVYHFFGNIIGDANPLQYIPWFKDVGNVLTGFAVDRPDMSVITDGVGYIKTMFNDDKSVEDKLWAGAELLGLVTGLPVANIHRDVGGIWRQIFKDGNRPLRPGALRNAMLFGIAENSIIGNAMGIEDTKDWNLERMYSAMLAGDSETAEEYRQHILLYNDPKKRGEEQLNSDIKGRIRDGYIAGDMDADTAMLMLIDYAGMDPEAAQKYIDNARYTVENDGAKYSDAETEFLESDMSTDEYAATMEEYGGKDEYDAATAADRAAYTKETGLEYGEMNSDYYDRILAGEDPEDLREEYADMKVTYGHMTRPDAYAAYEKGVLYTVETNGLIYNDMENDYFNGEFGEPGSDKAHAQVAEYRMEFGGEGDQAAGLKAGKWDYEKEYGHPYGRMEYFYLYEPDPAKRLDRQTVVKNLQKYGGLTPEKAYWEVEKWEAEKNGVDWGEYGMYTSLQTSFETGGTKGSATVDQRTAIDELYANNTAKPTSRRDSIDGHIADYYGALYYKETDPKRRNDIVIQAMAMYDYNWKACGEGPMSEEQYGNRRMKIINWKPE